MADNYRGITLSPHISKLFEMFILNRYGEYLWYSDLQSGFKKGIGCSHALYTIRSVVEYFTAAGSVINLCALDMSKAFDKVNHYALLIKLMDRSSTTDLFTYIDALVWTVYCFCAMGKCILRRVPFTVWGETRSTAIAHRRR